MAIAWLEQHADRLPPMVILLDLNLDGQDGHVLLEHLKEDPVFRRLPVVILTNSERPADDEFGKASRCRKSVPDVRQ